MRGPGGVACRFGGRRRGVGPEPKSGRGVRRDGPVGPVPERLRLVVAGLRPVLRGAVRMVWRGTCTWESRAPSGRTPVFRMILRFFGFRQNELTRSHVRIGGSVHMGA